VREIAALSLHIQELPGDADLTFCAQERCMAESRACAAAWAVKARRDAILLPLLLTAV
jgi:hypothetical protein